VVSLILALVLELAMVASLALALCLEKSK